MRLDIKTIYILITFMTSLMGVSLLYTLWGVLRRGKGLLAVIPLLHAAASILIAARGLIPDLFSMHLAVTAYSAAFSLSYVVVCRFFGRGISRVIVLAPIATVAAVSPFVDDSPERVIFVGLIYGLQHLFVIHAIMRIGVSRRRRALNLILLCNVIAGVTFFTRALLAFLEPGSFDTTFNSGIMQSATMLALFSSLFFYILGFLLLHLERESEEVLTANRELDRTNRSLKESEEMLRGALEEAESANRTKSEFLANMTHDIRTPMNSILGFTELLRARIEEPRQREFLDAIESSGKTLLGLINDILDLSAIEAGRLEFRPGHVDLADISRDIVRQFASSIAEKKLSISMHADPSLPRAVELDEIRIRQVLTNLVGNAIKFTEEGSISLHISSSLRPGGDTTDIVLSVADTGIGIPESERESIFDSFSQMKGQDHARYGGSGLGLSIARRLVEMMGGIISLESEVGKGSVFTVLIPEVPVISHAPEGPGGPIA